MNRLSLHDWQVIRNLVRKSLCSCDVAELPKNNQGKVVGNICQSCLKQVDVELNFRLDEAVIEKENRSILNEQFRRNRA